jgi:hypothetical protein
MNRVAMFHRPFTEQKRTARTLGVDAKLFNEGQLDE